MNDQIESSATGTDKLAQVLQAKYERMVMLGSWRVDLVEAAARETVGRLTATLPKTTDEDKARLATIATQFNQAFWAGVSAERQRLEAFSWEQDNAQRLAQAQSHQSVASLAGWRQP